MFFQRINRSDPEKVFITAKNSYSTSAVTAGQAVCWDLTTDIDGVSVTKPTTALINVPAGLVESTSIAAGEYGLIQVYGINTNAYIDGSSGTAGGTALRCVDTKFNLLRVSTAWLHGGFVFNSGSVFSTGAAAGSKKVFIRGL